MFGSKSRARTCFPEKPLMKIMVGSKVFVQYFEQNAPLQDCIECSVHARKTAFVDFFFNG
jgi:hypothetical protein